MQDSDSDQHEEEEKGDGTDYQNQGHQNHHRDDVVPGDELLAPRAELEQQPALEDQEAVPQAEFND